MKDNFDKAFEFTVGLEGGYSNDPNDPGGETKYGISKRFNPEVDVKNLTLEQAKDIYRRKYWLPAGCDEAQFPMDICLFDSNVNPQKGGNKELLGMNPDNWQEYMIFRMQRYMRMSKPEYVKGHIFRVLNLCEKIRAIK
jgi:hypothetical protein